MGHKEDLVIIIRVKEKIKDHPVVKRMFRKYKVPDDELDYVPMAFKEGLDVSARTAHGCIFFNPDLKNADEEEQEHYMIHELLHYLDQSTGTEPTNGSEHGSYLDNPEEVEAFQNQIAYIHDSQSPRDAHEYVEKVVNHHDLKGKKRHKKKEQLLDKCDD